MTIFFDSLKNLKYVIYMNEFHNCQNNYVNRVVTSLNFF